jgi:4-amino-4-deoxy-L-arabinose transferase-like glycosyltransferase
LPSAEPWQVEVARAGSPRLIEPPILEGTTALIYRLAGEELLWVPRLLAILCWTAGTALLFGLARSLGFRWGAVAAIAVMAFLPFAIQFSRAFLPEALMVPLLIAAMWAMVRYDERPGSARLAAVIVLTAGTGFVKALGLFVPYGVFAALAVRRLGWRRALRDVPAWAFAILAALPAIAWEAFGFWGAGFLAGQEDGRIMPELLLQPSHWAQTMRLITQLVTVPLLAVAILGLIVIPAGRARAVGIGAFAGYVGFKLVFSYHTATHPYYHLQLVPLVGLAVASAVDWLLRRPRLRPAVALVGLAGVVAGAALGISRMLPTEQQLAIIPVAAHVGEVVDHSARTVAVVDRPWPPRHVWFYGDFGGRAWILDQLLVVARAAGSPIDAKALLDAAVRRRDRYLVILDRAPVDAVPGLWELIRSRFAVIDETPDSVVFDVDRRPGR